MQKNYCRVCKMLVILPKTKMLPKKFALETVIPHLAAAMKIIFDFDGIKRRNAVIYSRAAEPSRSGMFQDVAYEIYHIHANRGTKRLSPSMWHARKSTRVNLIHEITWIWSQGIRCGSCDVNVPASTIIAKGAPTNISLPIVLGPQAPIGGRGKAGGVVIVRQAKCLSKQLISFFVSKIHGFLPNKLLAEELLISTANFIPDRQPRAKLYRAASARHGRHRNRKS